MNKLNKSLGIAIVVLGLILLPSTVALSQDFCVGNFDYDKDVDGTDAANFKSDFGRSAFSNPCPTDGPSPVPKTWQRTAYQVYDNGWWNNGLAWPNPRFTNNWNGSVTDNLTGLTWLEDANCSDVQAADWDGALVNAYFLHGTCGGTIPGVCGLTDDSCGGEWRLPNIKELQTLIDFDNYGPALPTGEPFVNVQSLAYWSSTTHPGTPIRAWYVHLFYGRVDYYEKDAPYHVWPVRGGH